MPQFELRAGSAHMTPKEAWLYAATWGSFMRAGDPGACMYGFDERFEVQSEEHRAACLAWIELVRSDVDADHGDHADNEKMKLFVAALKAAPIVGSGAPRGEFSTFNALDEFTRAYIECLFFTEEATGVTSAEWREYEAAGADDMGGSFPGDLGFDDLAPEALEHIKSDCADFQRDAAALLGQAYECPDYSAAQAGHDFWLTRNGHGAGFWDRHALQRGELGNGIRTIGNALSDVARKFGGVDTGLGDDGTIYL